MLIKWKLNSSRKSRSTDSFTRESFCQKRNATLFRLIGEKDKKSLYCLERHIAHWEKGIDKVLHHSSTLFLIHADDETSSPIENCNIAAQNIVLGVPTLGLRATFIGYVQKSWENSKKIRKTINLPRSHTLYACLAIGYPKKEYKRLVPRPELSVIYKN